MNCRKKCFKIKGLENFFRIEGSYIHLNQGKKLAESGVLLAIFALMLLMLLYIPLASIVIFFFMPAPFALISSKYDLKWSSLFLVASMLIAFIISGVGALPAPVMAGLVGITIGYYIRTNKSKLEMFIVSTLLFIACPWH